MTPDELKTAVNTIRGTAVEGAVKALGKGDAPRRLPVDPPAPAPAVAPEEPKKSTGNRELVIELLLNLPGQIRDCQAAYDEADRVYKTLLVDLTIKAFSEPLYPSKAGDTLRPASNETEREAAVEKLCTGDKWLVHLAEVREVAQRELRYAKDRFEAAQLVAHLIVATSNQ